MTIATANVITAPPLPITVNELIQRALRDAGVLGIGQAAQAIDMQDALRRLNMMIAQWNRKRWLVWHLLDKALVSTGAESYTVGSGGDFNIPRPDRIELAYFRQFTQPLSIDYSLRLFQSYQDYSRIRLKTLGSFPQVAFYDPAYPTGNLYIWPIPAATIYEIHILVKETIATFADLNARLYLPPEMEAALHYNLAVRLRPAYQLPVDTSLTGLAKDALETIRGANTQIPLLRMPENLPGHGSSYSIYSDQS